MKYAYDCPSANSTRNRAVRGKDSDADNHGTLDDSALEALLFPPPPSLGRTRPQPNWPLVYRELGRRGVTLDLLWNEYKAQEPDGYGYSWFFRHYERRPAALPVTLRQTHTPREKLFIDYSSNRPFKKLPGCRRSAFRELDRPALRPPPERPYQQGLRPCAAGSRLPARHLLKTPSYRFIASTLKNRLESKADAPVAQTELPLVHANVRGPSYYH